MRPAGLERGAHAAVDMQLRAGDVAGLVGGEEQRGIGDVLRRAEARSGVCVSSALAIIGLAM